MATIILAILVMSAAGVYTNFYNSVRNLKAANLVYEEARFTMERIVKEVRSGTIDYEEYYNQKTNFRGIGINETYGQNYCQYSRQFYNAGPDNQYGTFDDASTGQRRDGVPPPIEDKIQDKLYLISPSGTQRTYIRRIEMDDGFGNIIGKIAMLKLVGKDCGIDQMCSKETQNGCPRDSGEGDGLIDTWECESGFDCKFQNIEKPLPLDCSGQIKVIRDNPDDIEDSSFVDITPNSLDITNLKFIITPQDDPHKAYLDPTTQIQPHVTIKVNARANPKIANSFKGSTPSIPLESTISARAFTPVITECNLQECIDGDTKSCSAQGSLLSGAVRVCTQGIWPICDTDNYEQTAANNITAGLVIPTRMELNGDIVPSNTTAGGLDDESPFATEGGRTFYEEQNEVGSCSDGSFDENDIILCKQRRCSDGVDNDGNGVTDAKDPTCLFQICNNGFLDPGEECIDVGGICIFRQKTINETGNNCYDGYDNDCNYNPDNPATPEDESLGTGADEFDQSCVDYMCANGELDPRILNPFVKPDYSPKNYLLGAEDFDRSNEFDEKCIDIGGLCDNETIPNEDHKFQEEVDALCFDNWDNDCDYDELTNEEGADEFDSACRTTICSNNTKDCELAPSDYGLLDDNSKGYLMDYNKDILCELFDTDNDEQCIDAGGLCGEVPLQEFIYENILSDGSVCFDGLNQDCDEFADQEDEDCCPDIDSDGASALISGVCEPDPSSGGGIENDPGEIDCNDYGIFNDNPSLSGGNIKPGQIEICDDTRYPENYPIFTRNGVEFNLRSKPVDNNCSGVNDLYPSLSDNGWDHSDPACCVDTDGDGFGIESAYIYQSGGNCEGSAIGLNERPPYDCDDLNVNIHPGLTEDTPELCSDGLNNNCRFIEATNTKRKDHIDMYSDIVVAFNLELFEPECCDLTAMEICDDTTSLKGDGSNSDENCNGFAGLDDRYCIGSSGLMFYDNFTSSLYVNAASTAYHDLTAGTITISPLTEVSQTTLSNPAPIDTNTCSNVESATIGHSADNIDPPNSIDVTYEVSNDGGTTYEPYIEGIGNPHIFISAGVSLRWQATLTGNGIDTAPILNDITLDFTCN
ncbi:hypothetical protein KAR91_64570 [Candidatus Pacearchaeota archaeon]|nr:hypothetical protein [Candidatus Pacearchaeota archaeon]